MEDEEDYERASKALGTAGGANKVKKSVTTPAGKDLTVKPVDLVVYWLSESLVPCPHSMEVLTEK